MVAAWRLHPLAFAVGLVPLVAAHVALAISIAHGHVEACNPYLDGCTSISRAGRHGLANHVFQALMLPYATLLAAYWLACTRWIHDLGHTGSAGLRWMPWLGLVSALFLILYATFLGSEGDFYRLMRRYGVIVYFAFNFLAQLLLVAQLSSVGYPLRWLVRAKLALCVSVLALGLVNVGAGAVLVDHDALENIIEWNAALLMTAFYFLTWWAWRRDGFALTTVR